MQPARRFRLRPPGVLDQGEKFFVQRFMQNVLDPKSGAELRC
jgi:hypothetical protein